jgi:CubicO group peptidase (beta-lactamase class C family)
MPDPCQSLEQQLASLTKQRADLSEQEAADLKDAGPTQKASIIAMYKKEAKDLDQQLTHVRAELDQCVSRRDVVVEGPSQPGLDPFDLAVQRFMHRNQIRAGQLTILKDGIDILVHAYTFASTSYPRTHPKSLFRIASCSKAFTCAAINQLFADKLVSPMAPAFGFVGITEPLMGLKLDSRVDQITVQQLVDHAGGWNDHDTVFTGTGIIPGTNWDPVFHVRDIAIEVGLTAPPSKKQVAQYMYGQTLQFTPGTQDYKSSQGKSYSNFGYVLLGLVIERATNKSYIEHVREVLKPLGLDAHVFVSPMLNPVKNPLEVGYDDPQQGLNALQPLSFVTVPYPYGGEGFITELMDSGGGIMTTATTLALLAHNRAIWGLGPRVQAARTGAMAGTSSRGESRGDGVDYAFVFNTRHFIESGDPLKAFTDELESLFNTVKLPTPTIHFGPISSS